MKILISYYSETGNTKKIAEAIASGFEAQKDSVIDLQPIDLATPSNWQTYGLILIGTPSIRGTVAKDVREVLESLPPTQTPIFKLAAFVTYGVPDPAFYMGCIDYLKDLCKERNIEFIGEFCCLGEHRAIDRLERAHPEKASIARTSIGHPDSTDLNRAKAFAKELYMGLHLEERMH